MKLPATIPASLLLTGMLNSSLIAAPSSPEIIETLVVSGKQTPFKNMLGQRLSNDQVHFAVGARLDPAEVLSTIPGVQVDSRTNYAQDTRISLRGFGARSAFGIRGIDLLVDGVPMSMPDGQGQLSSVMMDTLASAQVLRGPLASLYGNSSGGVIALQTATPERNQLSLAGAGGDQGLERYHMQGDWHRDNFALRGQFSDTTVDGDRPHSRAEREQVALQLFHTAQSGLQTIVKHEQSDEPLLEDPLSLTPEQWRSDPRQKNPLAETFNTRKSVAHEQTSVSLRNQHGATRWQTALWQGEREVIQYLGFSGDAITSSGGVVDLARDFSGANATVTQATTILSVPLEITLGGEIAQMEDRRQGFVNNRGTAGDMRRDELGKVTSRDIYSLVEMNPTPQFNLYTGVRQTSLDVDVEDFFVVSSNPDDSGSRDFRERAFALGGSVELVDDWMLFASGGRGYESPTLTEMAYRSNGTGLNTALDAAINRQYQWGFGYERDEQTLTITHFQIDSENEIVVDQSVGGRTSFRNAAETEREGVELAARWTLDEAWRLQASAQAMRADYSAGQWSGNQLPGVAREQYQLGVEWRPMRNDMLHIDLLGQYRSRVFTADNNAITAPNFVTVDLSIAGQYFLGNSSTWTLDWWLKLANVSDENYVGSVVVNQANGRAFEPALRRNTTAGLKVSTVF